MTMITRKQHLDLCHEQALTCSSMTTLDHASHVTRRKGYAPHYTPANLALFQPEIHDITLDLIKVSMSEPLCLLNSCYHTTFQYLEHVAGRTPLDCLMLFRNFMVDVLVSSSYGYRIGAVKTMKTSRPLSTPHELCTAIALFPIRGVLVGTLQILQSSSHAGACSAAQCLLGHGNSSVASQTSGGGRYVTLIRFWQR